MLPANIAMHQIHRFEYSVPNPSNFHNQRRDEAQSFCAPVHFISSSEQAENAQKWKRCISLNTVTFCLNANRYKND
jgi:hypothetical protein